ncbi:MAG: tRNA uridine-5-carboxymethylaminomethyl(34) synthesis GTPase MnmE [Syntrophomonadaceae bacterium]|nr:tRNA uridine-5-carboxymethylaminomethyl(34) synthesis GTPase MnmE [Syntrophomonadaceae bacterium]
MLEDTIAAITTAYGEAAVGIVRISGPQAAAIAKRVLRNRMQEIVSIEKWASHTLHKAEVWDAVRKEKLDEVLVAVMWGPRSYTGEDVIELQGHGGRLVIQEVLQVVLQAGARLAEPGEFTRRAFINGRLDLAQAEAVIELIRARSEGARRLALQQLQGQITQLIRELKHKLIGVTAGMEAVLDFPEEGLETSNQEVEQLTQVIRDLEQIILQARTGRTIREGIRVVIIGKPNVGKSSLWNTLIGEDRAIVTEMAGTTRDVMEEEVIVKGIPIRLVDTAGIRETMDLVERIGVEKARDMLRRGQVVIVVLDAGEGLGNEDQKVLELVSGLPLLLVVNKSDLEVSRINESDLQCYFPGQQVIWASMKEKWGIEEIKTAILHKVLGNIEPGGEEGMISSIRHEDALRRCLTACQGALKALQREMPSECVLVDIYEALECLGEITGETVSEQVLDRIFSEFCIGK